MPARRTLGPKPKDYLVKGRTWPQGPLTNNAPDAARFAMEIARRLKIACRGSSQRAVAEAADVDLKTVNNIINGRTWAEVPTIFQLEQALQTHLWPTYHITDEQPPTDGKPDPPSSQWWKWPKDPDP